MAIASTVIVADADATTFAAKVQTATAAMSVATMNIEFTVVSGVFYALISTE